MGFKGFGNGKVARGFNIESLVEQSKQFAHTMVKPKVSNEETNSTAPYEESDEELVGPPLPPTQTTTTEESEPFKLPVSSATKIPKVKPKSAEDKSGDSDSDNDSDSNSDSEGEEPEESIEKRILLVAQYKFQTSQTISHSY